MVHTIAHVERPLVKTRPDPVDEAVRPPLEGLPGVVGRPNPLALPRHGHEVPAHPKSGPDAPKGQEVPTKQTIRLPGRPWVLALDQTEMGSEPLQINVPEKR